MSNIKDKYLGVTGRKGCGIAYMSGLTMIAFIVSELFTEKRHGGFGRLVRLVCGELVRRDFEVYVLAWHDPRYPRKYSVDGIRVIAYDYHFETRSVIRHLRDYWEALRVIRDVDADVYIGIETMVETLLAELVMRRSGHVVWAQDSSDWRYELMSSVDPHYKISRTRFLANRVVFGQAYRHADLILTQARFYVEKLRGLYGIDPSRTHYLPNPVHPILERVEKSETPLVAIWLGWTHRRGIGYSSSSPSNSPMLGLIIHGN